MKVFGIDPAPRFGAHLFDGTYRRVSTPDLAIQLQSASAGEPCLVCWDAPLTGPPDPDKALGRAGEFTKRPIETFFSQKDGDFKVPDGIAVQGYAACQHWTVSRHLLGLPRVGPWDANWTSLPFTLLSSPPPNPLGHYVVEVHPALALWLWCGSDPGPWKGPWSYKENADLRNELWRWLCDKLLKQISSELYSILIAPGSPQDDNDLDARVAWLLGELLVRDTGQVAFLGDLATGSFLLPVRPGLADAWRSFVTRRGAARAANVTPVPHARRKRIPQRTNSGDHQQQCLCCQRGFSFDGPRVCPICNHEFRGNGWDGIDAHWRSRRSGHEDVMSYQQFWQSLCAAHRDGR